MPIGGNGKRITSKDIVVQYIPGNTEISTLDAYIKVDTAVTTGDFVLWVNGEYTAAITFSETEATLVASIQSALDALPGLGAGEITVASSGADTFELTAAVEKFYKIKAEFAGENFGAGLTGGSARLVVNDPGAHVITLTAFLSSVSVEQGVETTSVTAINEFEETSLPTLQTMTFEVNMYEAVGNFGYAFEPGEEGLWTIYEEGFVVGKKYFAFCGLIDSASIEFPDHDKVEIAVSGMRQGKMVIPFDTIYQG